MKRVEIIANRSILEDLFDYFEKHGLDHHYTILPLVHGRGSSGPKKGDAIWPEENFLMIIYCEDGEVEKIAAAIREMKTYFPDEGAKMFASPAEAVV
jgi:nitrogen regulatory protein PII